MSARRAGTRNALRILPCARGLAMACLAAFLVSSQAPGAAAAGVRRASAGSAVVSAGRVAPSLTTRRASRVAVAPGAPQTPRTVQSDLAHGNLSGLAIDAWSGWPMALVQGYLPVFVRVANDTDAPEIVTIEVGQEVGHLWGQFRMDRTLRLAPGEERLVELFSPAFVVDASGFRFGSSVKVSSARGETFYASFAHEAPDSIVWPMIVTRDAAAGAAPVASGLADAIASDDFAVQLSGVASDRLPRRLEAYTSLAAVLVDTRAVPSASALEPALAWTRLGGTLAFVGPGAEDAARSLAAVRPWMEERFRRFHRGGDGSWRMGHGRLLVVEADDPERPAVGALVRAALADARPPGSLPRALPRIPGLGELPYRAFALLMIVFAVLVGPINFIVLRRTNRNALLLVTIPALAGAVSLVFLLYGMLHQGLDVKRAEFSLTLLDQRARVASTVSARQVFAGLVPGGGMHPAPGTVVLPRPRLGTRLYTVRLDDAELSMAGDYLPARDSVDQVVLTDQAARLRIVLEREGDALHAENALAERVLELAYLTPDGAWFAAEEPLEPGRRARRVPRADDPSAQLLARARQHDLWSGPLPTGTFVALLQPNPFLDDCGLDSVEYEGWHVVVGIPEEAP